MKKIFISLSLFLSACSSFVPKPEELQAKPQCVIWKNGPLGMRHIVEPQGETLKVESSCRILNTYWCSTSNYKFDEAKGNVISINGDGVAALDDRRITVVSTISKVEPFYIGKNKAEYAIQGPFGPKQNMSIDFNDQCTTKQAALGVIALLAK